MYIYGRNVAREALKKEVEEIYLQEGFSDDDILNKIKNFKILKKKEMDALVSGNHQGIILKVKDYEYTNLEDIEGDFLVILDHIEDPHNLGAIIRTCEAAGVSGIILPKNRSVAVNETVMKTSSGALENIKIAQVTNLNMTIKNLKKKGFWFIGTDMIGTNYKEIDYSGKIAVVIGNEGSGMNHLTKQEMDFTASIPMKGKVNSLNASVAAGIIIFEAASRK